MYKNKDAWELYDLLGNLGPMGGMRFNCSVDGWFIPDDVCDMTDSGRFNDFDLQWVLSAEDSRVHKYKY